MVGTHFGHGNFVEQITKIVLEDVWVYGILQPLHMVQVWPINFDENNDEAVVVVGKRIANLIYL